jgi:hypothetical protein
VIGVYTSIHVDHRLILTVQLRCVQLNYVSGGQDDPAAWTDFIAKTKDAIVTTLDGRVAERIDDVRRTEAQRAVPGWNFCTFFVLKVSETSKPITGS